MLLLDDQTFEVMDRFQLDSTEARHLCESPCSAQSCIADSAASPCTPTHTLCTLLLFCPANSLRL